jgi:hypothetical protein
MCPKEDLDYFGGNFESFNKLLLISFFDDSRIIV